MSTDILIREGKALLELPEYKEFRGPGSSELPVFYNPTMRVDRDLLVLVVRHVAEDGWVFLDGLSASGVRALRVALESGKKLEVHACDHNPVAVNYIYRNAELNGVHLRAHKRDLNSLLPELEPHFVDMDAFGSPAPFLDTAIQYVRTGGVIALTATDTSTLVGTHPRTCMRRYWARSGRIPQKHESAIRILLGYALRVAAKYERSIMPLLSFKGKHFYRLYFKVIDGLRYVDEALRRLLYLEPSTFTTFRASDYPYWLSRELIGPMWGGELEDNALIERVMADISDSSLNAGYYIDETRKLLNLLKGENISFLYHEVSWECKKLRISPPSMSRLRYELERAGYKFARTHFSSTGVKTDMPLEEFRELLIRLWREAKGL